VAASLGAKVFDFPWIDDFSAARNECLRHATGGYIFWMDADEVIDDVNSEKLRALFHEIARKDTKITAESTGNTEKLPDRSALSTQHLHMQ
jgi:glycosyltransferase involved in cell wall biosynthesis